MRQNDTQKAYLDFLKGKMTISHETGIDIDPSEITPSLYPHVKDTVRWAVKGGCRAIFSSFGMQKTVTQLEILRLIIAHEGGKALIVCPKRVVVEFLTQAKQHLGLEVQYVKTMQEVHAAAASVLITNYERVRDGEDGVRIDPSFFVATSLDEASVLRGFGTKTYQEFLPLFSSVKYRFVATATPSPNRYKELIHYSAYLGILDSGACLTMFFKRDSTKANNLTINPAQEEKFWTWVSTWALFLTKPSDLGYEDVGYELPPLIIHEEIVPVDNSTAGSDKEGQIKMFREAALGLADAAKERRDSLDGKIQRLVEIINRPENKDDHFLLWHDLEDERRAICKVVEGCKAVYGSQDDEEADQIISDFKDGRLKYLAAKPEMLGEGLNFQYHCHKAIMFIDYRFNDKFQAIARIHRFMQKHDVHLYLVYAESEGEIFKSFMRKWEQHKAMVEKMTDIVRKNGLFNTNQGEKLMRWMFSQRQEESGKTWRAINNDNVLETMTMPDNSVDLIVTSIPFCYDENTEILTKDGWKSFQDLEKSDIVATYNEGNKSVEYQKPMNIVNEPYRGEMIEFKGRAFDLMVTPNHRMYAKRRRSDEDYRIYTAEDIIKSYETCARKSDNAERMLDGFCLKVTPENPYIGESPEKIYIPKLPSEVQKGHGVELYWIDTEDFMKLAGWYLAEGHADLFGGRLGGRINIGQSPTANPDNYDEIVELFNRIGLPPSLGKNQISVWCRNLAHFLLSEFGYGEGNKRIPRWIFNLDGRLLTILRDTMMKGDGAKVGTSYASISPQLRDDFQELCVLTGWRSILSGGKIVYTGTKQTTPEIRHTPKRHSYSGRIGCVTVPNGLVIVRRNGYVCISGNSNHYEYTPTFNDFGHNSDNDAFFRQMDFLTPELMRVLKPGRLACIHVKDRVLFGNATGDGMPTIDPFSEMSVFHYLKHGFRYMGRITIDTDVVRENNQTYRLGYTEMLKDGTKMGIGCPEYILLFRKLPTDTSRAYADIPVRKDKAEYSLARWQIDAHASWKCSGDRLLSYEDVKGCNMETIMNYYKQFAKGHIYNYADHVCFSEQLEEVDRISKTFMTLAPVSHKSYIWDDIVRMKTLNTNQSLKNREAHICPLQTDIIERCIERYSNRGEVVFDPFGGIQSVPYCAVKMGRKGLSIELNASYWRDGLSYLRDAEADATAPTLFDLEEFAVAN